MAPDVQDDPAVEALTQDYGREIFARLGQTTPLPFSPSWWDERLMNWTMAAEAVKVQLFRFIDVLPLLHSPAEINRHLREYFNEAKAELPRWMTAAATGGKAKREDFVAARRKERGVALREA